MIQKPDYCSSCVLGCKPYGSMSGFVPADGPGTNGILVVAEAAGADEVSVGVPLVGKSGYTLWQQLKRVNIDRDEFMVHNILSCRPPDNKLVKMSYESQAVEHCKKFIGETIEKAKAVAKENGKTFVIVTLGATAFKAVVGLDYKKDAELLKKDYYAYPHWSQVYNCWVLNAPHPAFLLRGNTHLWPVVQFVFQRALEIASNGLTLDEPKYELDPSSTVFDEWIKGYERTLVDDPDNPLSYDIETPYKKKTDSEDDLGKEEDADHTILRIAFSYWSGDCSHTVSVKWSAEFMAGIERLFRVANYILGWNSDKYDYPRVRHFVEVKGIGLDGMVAWHILNSSLPKALGFVTPYYWQTADMWKHLSEEKPAFYNAKDADAALRCWRGIKADLIKNRLWHVYERHWIDLHRALKFMSGTGVLRDEAMRGEAETLLAGNLDRIEKDMEGAVPDEAKDVKIYKKLPKTLARTKYDEENAWHDALRDAGLFELVKEYPTEFCGSCGLEKPSRWKKHSTLCGGEATTLSIPQTVWAKHLEFKLSKKRMQSYQQVARHQAVVDRKEGKVTFNADAIVKLVKQYPQDKLYPLILDHRKSQKLLGTYVGVSEFKEVEVPDNYLLQEGEKWA